MEKKRLFGIVTTLLIICILSVTIYACDNTQKELREIDYANFLGNDYEVVETHDNDGKLYQPQGKAKWGFIFYLGTAMNMSNYDYILNKIASKGIAVYVVNNMFADIMYNEEEKAYKVLGDINYFIGGHSQGGGAGLRRAIENPETTKGCVFYSALVSNQCTLADTQIPAILFEAENDNILSSKQKQDTKNRMNSLCTYVLLEGANHMCYGKASVGLMGDGENTRDKQEIQDEIVVKTLEFMDKVIKSNQA